MGHKRKYIENKNDLIIMMMIKSSATHTKFTVGEFLAAVVTSSGILRWAIQMNSSQKCGRRLSRAAATHNQWFTFTYLERNTWLADWWWRGFLSLSVVNGRVREDEKEKKRMRNERKSTEKRVSRWKKRERFLRKGNRKEVKKVQDKNHCCCVV